MLPPKFTAVTITAYAVPAVRFEKDAEDAVDDDGVVATEFTV